MVVCLFEGSRAVQRTELDFSQQCIRRIQYIALGCRKTQTTQFLRLTLVFLLCVTLGVNGCAGLPRPVSRHKYLHFPMHNIDRLSIRFKVGLDESEMRRDYQEVVALLICLIFSTLGRHISGPEYLFRSVITAEISNY